MNDKLLTVKELASIVGVTTQNIYHHMKNNIKEYVVKTDDGTKIKASVITEYYKIDLQNDLPNELGGLQNKNDDLQNESNENNVFTSDLQNDLPNAQMDFANETNDLQKEMIQFLKEQIEQKDNLLKNSQAELNIEREHSRQQADRIAGLAEQIAELTRNQQVLFGMEQQKSLPKKNDVESSTIENDVEEKPPKGLFKKLFNKKK